MNDLYYQEEELEYEFETTASEGGGCFPGLLLPPFIVILVGIILGFISSGAVINIPVSAASNPSTSLGISSNQEGSIPSIFENSGSGQSGPGINANPGNNEISGVFTPEVQYWKGKIAEWSTLTGLDANLIATVMQIESCGDPHAKSPAGAMGLFQVMPFHFYSYDDPYEPDTNALRGMSYLKKSLEDSNGDARLAFAGYNGGISVIRKAESSWADETQRYVYWGGGIYQDASQGAEESQVLQEWLSRGGASLCKQAADRLGLVP
jgi:hypothetical protein